jgi:hypothetical protein
VDSDSNSLGDPVQKTVGRQTTPNQLEVRLGDAASKKRWRDAGFGISIPKGVYRFKSHEEADEWLMDHLTRKPETQSPASLRSKTS